MLLKILLSFFLVKNVKKFSKMLHSKNKKSIEKYSSSFKGS